MALTAESAYFVCVTEQSNIYWVEASSLKNEIRNTCHNDRINNIQFPYEYSSVFGAFEKVKAFFFGSGSIDILPEKFFNYIYLIIYLIFQFYFI